MPHTSIAVIKSALEESNLKDWLNDCDIENLVSVVSQLEPGQTYVEIGVAFGASSAIACAFSKPGVRIYAIDTLDQLDREKNMRTFLEKFGRRLEDCDYNFIHGDSQFVARFWDKGHVDVLFIDGDHTYEGVVKDVISWFPWVIPTGVIIFDDYVDGGGVKRAINELLIDHKSFGLTAADRSTFVIVK